MASKRGKLSPFGKAVDRGNVFEAAQLLKKKPLDTTRNQATRVQQLLTPGEVKRLNKQKSPLNKLRGS